MSSAEVPPTGIHVEVDHPETGHTWTLNALDDSQYLPQIRGKPTLEAVVPASETERWLAADWEGEEPTMRAWEDGQRLPIEELRRVKPSPDGVTLIGEGGSQLDNEIDKEINQEEAWLAARAGVQSNTSYATDFDDPGGSSFEKLLQDVSGESELESFLNTAKKDTDPFEFVDGGVQPLQTCWTVEAEEAADQSISALNTDYYSGSSPDSGDGQAARFETNGQYIEFTFTNDYKIPDGEFALYFRWGVEGFTTSDVTEVEFILDDTSLGSFATGTNTLQWEDALDGILTGGSDPGAIPAGTHNVRIEAIATNTDDQYIDVVAPLDLGTRFGGLSYNFDNDVSTNSSGDNFLDGPQWYPDALDIVFADAGTAYNVVGARVAATLTAADGDQAIAVSNDQGSTYKTASNTDSASFSFTDAGGQLRFRATLGRTGSQDVTPATGITPHRLDGYELYGDLEDSPVAQARRYTTSVLDYLNALARYSNSIWELQWDESAGKISVEWTRPGQRTATSDEALVDYQFDKDLRVYKAASVAGASRPRAPEAITADHGTAVSLSQDDVVTSSETVTDPSTGEEFVVDVDYRMDYGAGEITTLASGSITDGQTVDVQYRYEPVATYEADDYDPAMHRKLPQKKINAITTEREAQQAALTIVQDLDESLVQASVTLSRSDAGRSLIDDLLLERLPTDRRMEIQSIEHGAGQVILQLGSRRQVEEVISDIKSRLGETAQRA